MPAVLKVGPPWGRTRQEIAALRTWQGVGAPVLLAADEARGSMLLERVGPGTTPETAQAEKVAALLRTLHVAPPAGMPKLGAIARERIDATLNEGRAPEHKAAWARATVDELERNPTPAVLLHGDFDERNLLVCAQRGLVAIDPQPCAGDPAYDAAHWAHGNRQPGRRARYDAITAASGLDRSRVRDWAAVVAIHG